MNRATSPSADNDPDAVSYRRSVRRAANGLLGNPLFRRHSPLVLGWSDEQLSTIAEKLRPRLPGEPTDRMVLAAAAVARSIVLEEKVTGRGVHYARGKPFYGIPVRYRADDPHFTWYFVTGAMDLLASAGLIAHHLGAWTYGRQSVAYATGELMAVVGPDVDVSEGRRLEAHIETIVLRQDSKKVLDYRDTAETESMRRTVRQINGALSELGVRHFGRGLRLPTLRRIFSGSFERGGRLYFQGTSVQNMSAADRLDLEIVVNGEPRPVVEIDYRALHISMAYSSAAEPMPPGDPYHIAGFDRAAVKLAVNVLFNAQSRRSAVGAVAKDLDGPVSVLLAQNPAASGDSLRDLAETLVSAVEHKHHRIREVFGTDCGARFQRRDSDIAVDVMLRMLAQTGRCPLPVHDSFIVADVDGDLLHRTMQAVAREHGLVLEVKEHRAVHTTIEDLIQEGSPLVQPSTGQQNRQRASPRWCEATPSSPYPLAGNSSDLQEQEQASQVCSDRHVVRGRASIDQGTSTRSAPPFRAPTSPRPDDQLAWGPYVNAVAARPP
ncbi:hypothetical protein ACWECW_22715 [Rhodococcus ruber]